jgi:Do/DeqQ family serine protease
MRSRSLAALLLAMAYPVVSAVPVVLTLAVVLAFPAVAEEPARLVPSSAEAIRFSYAPIVKRAVPAVVNVYARTVERPQASPVFDDPFFQQFFGGGSAAPRERVKRSLGSGVIVEADGLVVTNDHVIANATEVKVALHDKREFPADVVLRDPRADLAILRLKGVRETLSTLPFADHDDLAVGDLVLAIGNPFGVGQTVTSGIVSALARTNVGVTNFQSFIQTDAAINPGNSGGALVDMEGRLVGINTSIFSRSGGNIGIGFAIPSAMVRVVVESAKAGSDRVLRPWLGATLQNVTPDIAGSLGLERPAGALVAQVAAVGPSARAGIETGDVILAIDGVPVSDPDDFGYRFATQPLGGTAKVEVLRGGARRTVEVALAPAEETTPREEVKLEGPSPLAGATVANLSPALAEALGLQFEKEGVVITDVEENSTAASLGFRKKDVLVEVNGQPASNSKTMTQFLSRSRPLWRVTINRDGQEISSLFGG